jgi:hypothetical protein
MLKIKKIIFLSIILANLSSYSLMDFEDRPLFRNPYAYTISTLVTTAGAYGVTCYLDNRTINQAEDLDLNLAVKIRNILKKYSADDASLIETIELKSSNDILKSIEVSYQADKPVLIINTQQIDSVSLYEYLYALGLVKNSCKQKDLITNALATGIYYNVVNYLVLNKYKWRHAIPLSMLTSITAGFLQLIYKNKNVIIANQFAIKALASHNELDELVTERLNTYLAYQNPYTPDFRYVLDAKYQELDKAINQLNLH